MKRVTTGRSYRYAGNAAENYLSHLDTDDIVKVVDIPGGFKVRGYYCHVQRLRDAYVTMVQKDSLEPTCQTTWEDSQEWNAMLRDQFGADPSLF